MKKHTTIHKETKTVLPSVTAIHTREKHYKKFTVCTNGVSHKGARSIKFFESNYTRIGVRQTLQKELEDSELWLSREKEESTYRRDLREEIELINCRSY